MDRREFLIGGAAAAAGCAVAGCAASKAAPAGATAPFKVGEPRLQAASATSMGVAWSVSGLAKGVVEYADNPAFEGARVAKPGGLGLVPVDASALQVRLTGLEPATTYYYRTVTTPFTAYPDIYRARLGESVVGRTYAFTTLGTRNRGAFAMISDTHARWPSYERRAAYLKANPPALLVWNGDATNSTQDKETAVEIFLDPPVASADFAASVPMAFVYGNHDCRGSWMPHLDDVLLPRSATERTAAFAELNRNFAERLGDMALVGMDTGEDKPDAHPKWFGLANFEPYRRLQARWLEETLARPDIASAPFKVVFCHIPLYAAPDHPDHAHDGAAIDPHDWAFWSRECFDLWNPILEKGGVQLVVAGHRHRYRHDLPSPGRSWHQVLGGGHELGVSSRGEPDEGRFPTVVEGAVRDGRLVVTVHDVFGNRIADSFAI